VKPWHAPQEKTRLFLIMEVVMAIDFSLTSYQRELQLESRKFAADVLANAKAAELLATPEERFRATKPAYEAMVAAGFLASARDPSVLCLAPSDGSHGRNIRNRGCNTVSRLGEFRHWRNSTSMAGRQPVITRSIP
jgi:hypothetical protein